jgi:hypothetical protein
MHAQLTSLGLTDEDLITFDDFLLCAPHRRTREVLLTFVRFVVRRRDRHGVPADRTSSEETRQALLGPGPARVRQPASADALAQLDRALGAVGEGERSGTPARHAAALDGSKRTAPGGPPGA